MLSRCFLDFSVSVGAFVIGLSQISSLFSSNEFSISCVSENLVTGEYSQMMTND